MRTRITHGPRHTLSAKDSMEIVFLKCKKIATLAEGQHKKNNKSTKETRFSKLFTETSVETELHTYRQQAHGKSEIGVSAQRHHGCPVGPLVSPNHV